MTAVIVDRAFAAEMEAMFERDFIHADVIDPAELGKKPFWWRLGVQVSRLAARVLKRRSGNGPPAEPCCLRPQVHPALVLEAARQ